MRSRGGFYSIFDSSSAEGTSQESPVPPERRRINALRITAKGDICFDIRVSGYIREDYDFEWPLGDTMDIDAVGKGRRRQERRLISIGTTITTSIAKSLSTPLIHKGTTKRRSTL